MPVSGALTLGRAGGASQPAVTGSAPASTVVGDAGGAAAATA